jgi:hypothetical protein
VLNTLISRLPLQSVQVEKSGMGLRISKSRFVSDKMRTRHEADRQVELCFDNLKKHFPTLCSCSSASCSKLHVKGTDDLAALDVDLDDEAGVDVAQSTAESSTPTSVIAISASSLSLSADLVQANPAQSQEVQGPALFNSSLPTLFEQVQQAFDFCTNHTVKISAKHLIDRFIRHSVHDDSDLSSALSMLTSFI